MSKPRSFDRFFLPFGLALLLAACGSDAPSTSADPGATAPESPATATAPKPAGFYTAEMIDPPLAAEIDQGMIDEAMGIFNAKCKACHGLTEEKVVGPGWKGVYKEGKGPWIMNMMLHTQWMVENDPEAQALVEETKTIMPDQELTEEQARSMLELIRSL